MLQHDCPLIPIVSRVGPNSTDEWQTRSVLLFTIAAYNVTVKNENSIANLREAIRRQALCGEDELIRRLAAESAVDPFTRAEISARTARLVRTLRAEGKATFLQSFLVEYGLSTEEGVALMSMAEAFLRVPDAATLDELIAEKISGSNWQSHSGQASSFLVNASTWGLMLTGRLLTENQQAGLVPAMRDLLRRLGEPIVRTVMTQVMEQMGNHFVVGETIASALKRTGKDPRYQGYSFSFDMLGEAALTEADAQDYFTSYQVALASLADQAGEEVKRNSGISVKLSALHPRFELLQRSRSFESLLTRMIELSRIAAANQLNLNIDGEDAASMEFTLDIFQALAENPEFKDWQGLGIVVQAYSRNSHHIVDWLESLARKHNRQFMVRLVKGAYWDTEIKRAQVLGLKSYPVFTRKHFTDISYIAAARKLLLSSEALFPQFATHNAHTVSSILVMAEQLNLQPEQFEFQRLYGMGEELHERTRRQYATSHRIYAPVGVHEDLLAYLVRRLLENGANSSFVHQLTDTAVAVDVIAADPYVSLEEAEGAGAGIIKTRKLYPGRENSIGWDIGNAAQLGEIAARRDPWSRHSWQAHPLLAEKTETLPMRDVCNPARPDEIVGCVEDSSEKDLRRALSVAVEFAPVWQRTPSTARVEMLLRAARLIEENFGELLAILTRETGKTLADAIGEWREAIDFLRYYATQVQSTNSLSPGIPRGTFACIAPWNFPLSIFIGQIAAALVTGNTVLAKPAEQATLVAYRATQLLHEAGVPVPAMQLLPGDGARVGAALCSDSRLDGVSFTGSLEVARSIRKALAHNARVDAALIAETGGINAMIVDSTALPEQSVRDIVNSAFSSAGQRCSALRVVYLQEEIADRFIEMLIGAMNLLCVGDPWEWQTDVGPVIDAEAQAALLAYIDSQKLLHRVQVAEDGCYVSPVLIEVAGIADIEKEVFGPVLHVARFDALQLDSVIDQINTAGYGLTFSIHSRLTQRVDRCIDRLKIGNIYVNRNQIGAVVESQPFGGRGLSGTGPKAGGPHYLEAFTIPAVRPSASPNSSSDVALNMIDGQFLQETVQGIQAADWRKLRDRLALLQNVSPASKGLAACEHLIAPYLQRQMPGPTGERNIYQLRSDGCALCLGPSPESALEQALQAIAFGGAAVVCTELNAAAGATLLALENLGAPVRWQIGMPDIDAIKSMQGISSVSWCGDEKTARELINALAERQGVIVRFITQFIDPMAYLTECHVCNDITSSGGNVELMSGVE